jgi:hypothetical protein
VGWAREGIGRVSSNGRCPFLDIHGWKLRAGHGCQLPIKVPDELQKWRCRPRFGPNCRLPYHSLGQGRNTLPLASATGGAWSRKWCITKWTDESEEVSTARPKTEGGEPNSNHTDRGWAVHGGLEASVQFDPSGADQPVAGEGEDAVLGCGFIFKLLSLLLGVIHYLVEWPFEGLYLTLPLP